MNNKSLVMVSYVCGKRLLFFDTGQTVEESYMSSLVVEARQAESSIRYEKLI